MSSGRKVEDVSDSWTDVQNEDTTPVTSEDESSRNSGDEHSHWNETMTEDGEDQDERAEEKEMTNPPKKETYHSSRNSEAR